MLLTQINRFVKGARKLLYPKIRESRGSTEPRIRIKNTRCAITGWMEIWFHRQLVVTFF